LIEFRIVEGHRCHDKDRGIEEEQHKPEINPSGEGQNFAFTHHVSALFKIGRAASRISNTTPSKIKDNAAPNGQLKTAVN